MNIFSKSMTYKEYIKYLTPSVLTMVFLSFYTTIDGFFVSRFAGSDALAGINIVIPITCIIFGVSVMLSTGASAYIGEFMGKGDYERADNTFSLAALSLLIFSVIFTAVGIILLKPIVIFLGTSEKLMPHVLPYALVVFLGTIPMAFKLFFEYLVRSDGNPKTGLIMSFTGIILNIIADYIFVGIFKMGTLGAALGTVISISVSALMGFQYFRKNSTLNFVFPKFDFKLLIKSCINGSSEMLTELSTGITTLLFNLIIIKEYGEDGIAAVTIIMYIYYFFISFYMGIAVATAPVISYNLGADNHKKIRETLKYSFITIGAAAAVIMAFVLLGGKAIIGLFVSGGYVFDLTWDALKLFSPVFLFIGVNVFLSGYFTALGDGITSAIISSLRSFIFVILFLFTLPSLIDVSGIWLSMPFSEAATILFALPIFIKKKNRYI